MGERKKILLLNPPGKKLYIRDYYCSKVSQADYVYQPIDLLIQSGIIYSDFEPVLIDAIIERLSPEKTLKKILELDVSGVISLVGSVSWPEDISFLEELKRRIRVPIIASGDIFTERPEEILRENDCLDAIILDFTNNDALNFLKGNTDKIKNAAWRENSITKFIKTQELPGMFSIPTPRHEIFTGRNYRYPFVRQKKFATILSDFGCPFLCSFCIMSEITFKRRNISEIIQEIEYIRSIGINEFFLATQTFGFIKQYAIDFCNSMIEKKLKCDWLCFSRVDILNEHILSLMKRAGCHTIIFGVESGDEKILKKYRKGYTLEQIRKTIRYCNEIGIETVATFILGLPEESRESIEKTIALAKELPIDYASFNVAVPRMGTQLRDEALLEGLIKDNFKVMDQSGSEVAMPTKQLSQKTVAGFRRKAVLNFYFRPSYLFRRLSKIRDIESLTRQLRQALALVRQTWLNK